MAFVKIHKPKTSYVFNYHKNAIIMATSPSNKSGNNSIKSSSSNLKNSLESPVLHTEKEKKTYWKLEKEIKCTLNELFLLNKVHLPPNESTSAGLSITKDFWIRELTREENNKYLANPANIKRGTIDYDEHTQKKRLFDLIDRQVKDPRYNDKYKSWITNFFEKEFSSPRFAFLRTHPLYRKFLSSYNKEYKEGRISTDTFNAVAKVSMILQERLWNEAFSIVEKDGKEHIEVSQKSLKYLWAIFSNVNQVRKDRGGDLNQIFHDGDFPFIVSGEKKDFNAYIQVFVYLLSHKKHNPFGQWGADWDAEWTKKTWQYADMLWACADPVLEFHTDEFLSREDCTFEWSAATKKIFVEAEKLLKTEVKAYNEKKWTSFVATARLKSLSSCLEKIIEGKKLNDKMGFRVSMQNANGEYYDDIKELWENWKLRLHWNMRSEFKRHDQDWKEKVGFLLKSIVFDNKWVLSNEQIEQMREYFEHIFPDTQVQKRKSKENPYISKEEWTQLMEANYPNVYKKLDEWAVVARHYDNFSQWVARWHNGSYKDFKENIVCQFIDATWEARETTMELQFDDLENNIGLANYNIRNAERAINTANNSMFTKPLKHVTRTIETHLKKMANQVTGKWEKYSTIDFWNGIKQDISWFIWRDRINSADMDKTIVEIINYFIKQGKFIFYIDAKQRPNKFPNWLLSAQHLHDPFLAENLHICSNLWLSKQQHSYLLSNRSDQVGVYMPESDSVWWMKLRHILDYMNLGKKKFKELAYIPEGIETIDLELFSEQNDETLDANFDE